MTQGSVSMNDRPIIDAGPGLNGMSLNRERLLIGVLGPISAPECVEAEVLRKSRQDHRFRTAAAVWRKMAPRYLEILSDDPTPELENVIRRLCNMPPTDRAASKRDLGELMVIAHGVVLAESGATVIMLIDDGGGARLAASEMRRLDRMRRSNQDLGRIILINTLAVLAKAVQAGLISKKEELRALYQQLRLLDDGLPPIESTGLMSNDRWPH